MQAAEAFDKLHYATLQKQHALQLFYDVTTSFHTAEDTSKELQHLWLKLHRKYKFKFKDYEKLQLPTSIHAAIFNDQGHGFQTVMRFYEERKLEQWHVYLFQFGLATVIQRERFQNLAIYFCNSLICEPAFSTLFTAPVHHYFEHHAQPKVQELYTCYTSYMTNRCTETATSLYKLLKALNPHYKLEAKATPQLFKQLHAQKASVVNV